MAGGETISESAEKLPLLNSVMDGGAEPDKRPWYHAVWRQDCAPFFPARYVLTLLSCLGFVNVYILRVNLSVALVQMDSDTATVTNRSARVFDWSPSEQGWVLSSFFIGYLFLQLPAGWLAQKIGGKWLFGVGILGTSVLTLLTPVAADFSVWALISVRVIEGLFEGVTYPAMHAMWGKWAPPNERSRLISVSYAGANIGVIIGFPLSGILCEYGFDGGWPSVFYVFGVLGIIWFIAWIGLAYNSPATHPRISRAEREYIERSIGDKNDEIPTPWLELLTSMPFWAASIAYFTLSWGSYTIITCLPTYFNQALGLKYGKSILLNGVYSAIPFVASIFVVYLGSFASDFAIVRGVSTTAVRKACIVIGQVTAALFLLLCGFFANSLVIGVTYVTISIGILALSQVCINPNLLDIAPRYAGVTMAIANTLANVSGIIAPMIAKAIAAEPPYIKGSAAYQAAYKDEWREVFVIGAMVLVFGALVHLIMGSGQKQPWANGTARWRRRARIHNDTCTDSVKVNGSITS